MTVVIIIVMCIVAVGISVSRISALRARNRAERDEAKKSAHEISAPAPTPTAEEGAKVPHATFADYLDAENAPTLTRAQMDEWRRDFLLACKYGRRPPKGKAPFMQYLCAEGFSLPYKLPIPSVRAVKVNEKALPRLKPQKSLSASCKASYQEYRASDAPTGIGR